jgi:hypothetical protein
LPSEVTSTSQRTKETYQPGIRAVNASYSARSPSAGRSWAA